MSTFARRHYVKVARILRDFREAGTWDERTIAGVETEFVNVFRADNPRFVEATFREACAPLVMMGDKP